METSAVNRKSFVKDKRAVSPAISMTILTAATIIMVLVASSYAYTALGNQQGATEYQAVQKSFLTFDDAIRDVGWDRGSARSTRFSCNYGVLDLVPNVPLNITIQSADFASIAYNAVSGVVKYAVPAQYVNLGDGTVQYLVGNESSVIDKSTDDMGKILVCQNSAWVHINMSYRVRVLEEPSSGVCKYVDILILKLNIDTANSYKNNFDLVARNTGISATTYGPYSVSSNDYSVTVNLGGDSSTVSETLPLDANQVVFNVVVGTVNITG